MKRCRASIHNKYLLPLVRNKSIAGNQHNLGNFELVTVYSYTRQSMEGIVMFVIESGAVIALSMLS